MIRHSLPTTIDTSDSVFSFVFGCLPNLFWDQHPSVDGILFEEVKTNGGKKKNTFIWRESCMDRWRDFTLRIWSYAVHLQRDSLNSFKGCLWRQKTLVTTHIYNISETISDSSVKFWLCFLPLQDMHTRQLQKNIRVSPVWRISRWIIQIQFQ